MQAGIKMAMSNISNLRYTDDIILMAGNDKELKSFLMKLKEGSEKASLKLSIQKNNVMAFSLITSWQIDEEKLETAFFPPKKVTDFIFLDPKPLQTVIEAMKLKHTCSLEGKL